MVSVLYECPFSKAMIRFRKTGTGSTNEFAKAASEFTVDESAVGRLHPGIERQGEGINSVLQQALDTKERMYGPGHPQLLGYYYFLGQLNEDKGAYPAAVALDKKGLAACNKTYGPGSSCSVILQYRLGTSLASMGDNAGSEAALREALANCTKLFGPDAPVSGLPLNASVLLSSIPVDMPKPRARWTRRCS